MPRGSGPIRRAIVAGRARDRGLQRDRSAEERVEAARLRQSERLLQLAAPPRRRSAA